MIVPAPLGALGAIDWSILVVYLGGMVALGIYLARSGGNFDDF